MSCLVTSFVITPYMNRRPKFYFGTFNVDLVELKVDNLITLADQDQLREQLASFVVLTPI